MYYETNLAPSNSYYRVTAPFPVYHLAGHGPFTTYVGSSRVLTPVYVCRDTEVGGEIHNLHGGLFYVSLNARITSIVLRPDTKHVFERRYMPEKHNWPLDALLQIDPSLIWSTRSYLT